MGQYEDEFYTIYKDVEEKHLKDEFDTQLLKMKYQDKHKFKNVKEKWGYAYLKIMEVFNKKKN